MELPVDETLPSWNSSFLQTGHGAGEYVVNTGQHVDDENGTFSFTDLGVSSTALTNGSIATRTPPATFEVVVLLSLMFCVIGAVGLLGNSLVILVILLDKKMRQSATNIFIMNLAAADLLILLVGVPEIVQFMLNRGWLLGLVLCKINRVILVVSLYVSILSLVSVCIERYVAIVYPIKAHILCGRRKIIVAVSLIWPVGILCGLPTLVFNTVGLPHHSVPYPQCYIKFPALQHYRVFEFTQFVIFYFTPVVIQAILYAIIGRRLYASTEELHTRFQMRQDTGVRCRPDKMSDTIKSRKNVVKMLAASVFVYILCYAPPQVLLFYDTFSSKPFPITWSFRVFSIVISNVNSAANPVLYSIFSQNFRGNFKKYLCFVCLRRKDSDRPRMDSFDSKGMPRKLSSTRTTTISRI